MDMIDWGPSYPDQLEWQGEVGGGIWDYEWTGWTGWTGLTLLTEWFLVRVPPRALLWYGVSRWDTGWGGFLGDWCGSCAAVGICIPMGAA